MRTWERRYVYNRLLKKMSEVNEVVLYKKPRGVVVVERDWMYTVYHFRTYTRRVHHNGTVNTKRQTDCDIEEQSNNDNRNNGSKQISKEMITNHILDAVRTS